MRHWSSVILLYAAAAFFCGFGAFFCLLGTIAWFATHTLSAVISTCIPSAGVGLAFMIAVWVQALPKPDAEGAQKRVDLERLKAEIDGLGGPEITAERWGPIAESYQRWEGGLTVSNTNRRLQLLKIVSEAFPERKLRDDPKIVDLILADLKKPGDMINARCPNGRIERVRVIRREIIEKLGVSCTLEDKEGNRFTNEYSS